MDEGARAAKQARIDPGRREDRCPNCWEPLGADAVGPGYLSQGRFCNLDCQAAFYPDYYRERARASNPSRN